MTQMKLEHGCYMISYRAGQRAMEKLDGSGGLSLLFTCFQGVFVTLDHIWWS